MRIEKYKPSFLYIVNYYNLKDNKEFLSVFGYHVAPIYVYGRALGRSSLRDLLLLSLIDYEKQQAQKKEPVKSMQEKYRAYLSSKRKTSS